MTMLSNPTIRRRIAMNIDMVYRNNDVTAPYVYLLYHWNEYCTVIYNLLTESFDDVIYALRSTKKEL